jgi:hypothetical protein
MISNTDSILLIYSTENIRVKVYTGRDIRWPSTFPLDGWPKQTKSPDSEQRGVKVVRELLRQANSRITLHLYPQAGMPNKRLARTKLVRLVLNKEGAQA